MGLCEAKPPPLHEVTQLVATLFLPRNAFFSFLYKSISFSWCSEISLSLWDANNEKRKQQGLWQTTPGIMESNRRISGEAVTIILSIIPKCILKSRTVSLLAFNKRSTWVAVTYVTSSISSVSIQSLPARFTCEVSQTCNSESWLATGAIVLELIRKKNTKYSRLPAASYAVSSAHKCSLPLLRVHHSTALYFNDHPTLAVITWYLSVYVLLSLCEVIFENEIY